MDRPLVADPNSTGRVVSKKSTELTKPRKGTRIAKVDVERLAPQYAAESKMIGSSAIRFISEEPEDFDFERDFNPPRCKCTRVLAFRLAEYQRRVKEKRPDQTLGDVLDDMGIDGKKCISCRDYFINQFKFTTGTLNSGDVTILPADETRPFPRRIENNLPRDLYLESKEVAYYDKWSPVKVPKSLLVKQTIFTKEERKAGVEPKMVPKSRIYHLTGHQIKANFDSYLELYKVWSRTMGKLLPIWAEVTYPDLDFEETRTLIESAFFQELCGVFEKQKSEAELERNRVGSAEEDGSKRQVQRAIPRPTRKNLFEMQIKTNIDQYVEDRQNCYLYFRSNDKPPVTRAALLIPTAKRSLYFTFSETELVLRDDYRFAGDSLSEIISGSTKVSEVLLGTFFSWKDSQVYISRGDFILPTETSVQRVIETALKKLQRERKLNKSNEGETRSREMIDQLLLSLDELNQEIKQVIHLLATQKAEAEAEIEDLDTDWQT